jgi:hypothetical protein
MLSISPATALGKAGFGAKRSGQMQQPHLQSSSAKDVVRVALEAIAIVGHGLLQLTLAQAAGAK